MKVSRTFKNSLLAIVAMVAVATSSLAHVSATDNFDEISSNSGEELSVNWGEYNPKDIVKKICDINHDGKLDDSDVNTALEKGMSTEKAELFSEYLHATDEIFHPEMLSMDMTLESLLEFSNENGALNTLRVYDGWVLVTHDFQIIFSKDTELEFYDELAMDEATLPENKLIDVLNCHDADAAINIWDDIVVRRKCISLIKHGIDASQPSRVFRDYYLRGVLPELTKKSATDGPAISLRTVQVFSYTVEFLSNGRVVYYDYDVVDDYSEENDEF